MEKCFIPRRRPRSTSSITDTEFDILEHSKINERQVKNVLKMDKLLTSDKNVLLTLKHVQKIMNV